MFIKSQGFKKHVKIPKESLTNNKKPKQSSKKVFTFRDGINFKNEWNQNDLEQFSFNHAMKIA